MKHLIFLFSFPLLNKTLQILTLTFVSIALLLFSICSSAAAIDSSQTGIRGESFFEEYKITVKEYAAFLNDTIRTITDRALYTPETMQDKIIRIEVNGEGVGEPIYRIVPGTDSETPMLLLTERQIMSYYSFIETQAVHDALQEASLKEFSPLMMLAGQECKKYPNRDDKNLDRKLEGRRSAGNDSFHGSSSSASHRDLFKGDGLVKVVEEQPVKEQKFADEYFLNTQDKSRLLQQLLNSLKDISITIAHGGNEKEVSSCNINSFYASRTSEEKILLGDLTKKPFLIYGFDHGYRAEVIKILRKLGFERIQKMNDYMQELKMGSGSTFMDCCEFIKDGVSKRRNKELKKDRPYAEKDLEAYAKFLEEHIDEFNFPKSIQKNGRKAFFFKNCDLQKILDPNKNQPTVSEDMKRDIQAGAYDKIINRLSESPSGDPKALSAFALLEKMKDLPLDVLQASYGKLSSDVRRILDVMTLKAFFRKTSKLGLSFAMQEKMTVLFSYTASKSDNQKVTLEELHQLLKEKPYKSGDGGFRIDAHKTSTLANPVAQLAPEATTFSEMRELGRLRSQERHPDYVLIRGMQERARLNDLNIKKFKSSL